MAKNDDYGQPSLAKLEADGISLQKCIAYGDAGYGDAGGGSGLPGQVPTTNEPARVKVAAHYRALPGSK